MASRPSAFGPTTGTRSGFGGRVPRIGGRRSSGRSVLSRLLQPDEPVDDLATPRAPLQDYEFTPLFPEAQESTGEEGGIEAAAGLSLPSAPLETPWQQSRQSLLKRLQESRERLTEAQEPGDVAEGFGLAKTAVGGAKTGLQGAKLFSRLLQDAGFTADSIKQFLPAFQQVSGGEFSPEAFGALAESVGSGGESVLSQLGEYAPYIGLLLAGLNVGQIASSGNLTDEQKAVASVGPAVSAAMTAAALAGSTAAGVFAGPVGMSVTFAIDHFLDMMQDVPHEVREGIDFNKLGMDANLYRRSLDEAGNAEQLYNLIVSRTNPRAGGNNAGVIYDADFRLDGQRRVVGKGYGPFQGATLEDLLAHPEAVRLAAQRGINPDMLAQVNGPLNMLVRNRLALFARARAGDPQALLSVQLLAKRGAMARKMRAKDGRQEEGGRGSRKQTLGGGIQLDRRRRSRLGR
jgi:hypothetical protein